MPRSRSSSMSSSSCSFIWRFSTVPVISTRRSASVDLPWSTWAMMEKLRIRRMSVTCGIGEGHSVTGAIGARQRQAGAKMVSIGAAAWQRRAASPRRIHWSLRRHLEGAQLDGHRLLVVVRREQAEAAIAVAQHLAVEHELGARAAHGHARGSGLDRDLEPAIEPPGVQRDRLAVQLHPLVAGEAIRSERESASLPV